MIAAPLILIVAIIFIALIFDFTNGFHDSANSISTVVSTKVLSPRNAVLFAAFFNFLAAFSFGVAVADTISNIVELNIVATLIIPVYHSRCAHRCYQLEPDHLVLWSSHFLIPCTDRGSHRRRHLCGRTCRH